MHVLEIDRENCDHLDFPKRKSGIGKKMPKRMKRGRHIMSGAIHAVKDNEFFPNNQEDFYRELTSRNHHFIPEALQTRLGKLKVLVAGCGSVGGACTLPLARLGIQHFRLADNGDYELNNLNRQHCVLENLGQNKAEFHKVQLLKLNPHCDVKSFKEGITPDNVQPLVQWADIILDAVDVTTSDGMTNKLLLHEFAKKSGKPTFMAMDLGFRQWGQAFDYRNTKIAPLRGRLVRARKAKHPLKALFEICPLGALPPHVLPMVLELVTGGQRSASQLACAVDQLSAIFAAAVVRYAKSGSVVKGWSSDLSPLAYSKSERLLFLVRSPVLRFKLRRALASLE